MAVPLSIILQKAFRPVLVILSALIAYQSALLTWSLFPHKESRVQWVVPQVISSTVDNKIATQKLQEQHLFGQVVKEEIKVKPKEEVSDAPKTKLNLTLVGVVAATDSSYSSAIIVYKNEQDSYFTDSIIEGTKAKVAKIYQDRVLLDVNGELQTLMLDGVETLEKKQQEHESATSAPSPKISNNRGKSEVKTISIDREALLKDPGKITDYIQISPVREDNEIKGYRVSPGKDKTLFEEAGLQSGDLAVEVNGVDLTDMQEALGLMKMLPTMSEITLTVEREGQLHEIYFTVP